MAQVMLLLWILCIFSRQIGVIGDIDTEDECTTPDSEAKIYCNYTTSDIPIVRWYKGESVRADRLVIVLNPNGMQVPQAGFDRHSVIDVANLKIVSTQVADIDTYWCEISGFGITTESKSATLTVIDAPADATVQLQSPIDESTEKQSEVTTMTCSTSDTEVTHYLWRKNGESIDTNPSSITLSESGKILTILNTTKEDSGNYLCTAVNCAGEFTSDAKKLVVNYACRVQIKVYAKSTNWKDEDITIEVTNDCFPSGNITWENSRGKIDSTDPVLKIKAEKNYRKVSCTACNTLGCNTASESINILNITLVGFILVMVFIVVGISVVIIVICVVKSWKKKKDRNREEKSGAALNDTRLENTADERGNSTGNAQA
ncbi:neural cell adhesion molecule 2-like isoform X2 [Glandiceps talaboti]